MANHASNSPTRAGAAPRRSASAAQSRELERERIRRLSVHERIVAALGMSERFAWLKPASRTKPL
jgi:hypothetical protein